MRVLIVDDDQERRDNLVGVFSTYCESDSADGGANAVSLAIKGHESLRPYTFIVLSHSLQNMKTPEVLRRIRTLEKDYGHASGSTVCILSSNPDCQKTFSSLPGHDPQLFFRSAPVDILGLLSIFKESNTSRLEELLRNRKRMPAIRTGLSFIA